MSNLLERVRFMSTWITSRLNLKSDRGATAVEYGLMVALISAVIIAAVIFLGQKTSATFQCTGDSLAAKAQKC